VQELIDDAIFAFGFWPQRKQHPLAKLQIKQFADSQFHNNLRLTRHKKATSVAI
jgi:hypothetical protein